MILHQVKVKCLLQNEEGELIPTATSVLLRRAVTYGEAETEVFKFFTENAIASFSVKGIGLLNADEVLKHVEDGDDELTWFKIKTRYGVEGVKKKMTNVTLIQHYTMEAAHQRLKELFANTSYDLEFTASSEVAIIEYIELPEAEKGEDDKTLENLTGAVPTVAEKDEDDGFFDEDEDDDSPEEEIEEEVPTEGSGTNFDDDDF